MIPVALLLLAFWVYSIVDCALQPPVRHRGVSKASWMFIVILIPVLGGVLWFAIGRTRASAMRAPRAPDDDLDFLGRIGSISDQDERIRRLEEELAALDAEDVDNLDRPGGAGYKGDEGDAAQGDATQGIAPEDDDPARRATTAGQVRPPCARAGCRRRAPRSSRAGRGSTCRREPRLSFAGARPRRR